MRKIIKSNSIWFIFLFFLLLRLFPYFNNPVPLGYDAGLYLLNFKTFPHIPQWAQLGFAPGLYKVVYPIIKLGISPEWLLIPLSIFSQIVLFFSFYFVSKKLFNEKVALLTVFIFSVSAIQFRTFWYFYLNNTFALGFLLLTLYFLCKSNFPFASLLTILVGLFHLPTFLILFLIILAEIIFNSKRRLFYLKVLLTTLAVSAFYYLPHYKQTIAPFIQPLFKSTLPLRMISNGSSSSGSFYSLGICFLLTLFYWPLSILGFYTAAKNKVSVRPFAIGFIIAFLLVMTQFFFFRRYFIMLDVFLVFFAGIGLNFIMNKYIKNQEGQSLLQFYFLILTLLIIGFVLKTSSPLIDKSLLAEIKQFGQEKQSAFVLSLSPEDHAWLMGYTNFPIIAHGYGGYTQLWNSQQWDTFYSRNKTEEKIKLLKLLPRPLYIFINDKNLFFFSDSQRSSCLKQKTLHFYYFTCQR
jgi:hypothetical protein